MQSKIDFEDSLRVLFHTQFSHECQNRHTKGELQCQNKLISCERPFKILQNKTKIIKIGQAVHEIFIFKDRGVGQFYKKKRQKNRKCSFFRGFAQTEEQ